MPNYLDLSPYLRNHAQKLRPLSPLLEFWEVATPDLMTPFLRYVDFADPDARGSLPRKVPFNGVEWDSIPIKRGDIEESAEAGGLILPVTILDPFHTAAFFLRQYQWLSGAKVKYYLAAYDNLANPSEAFLTTLVNTKAAITQGPDAVTLMLGQWSLYEERRPNIFYSRTKCFNNWPGRFQVGNLCNYPSNEFSAQTAQELRGAAIYEEKKRKYGWYTQMALKADVFSSHLAESGRLRVSVSQQQVAWFHDRRYGPFFYRLITGDFDVYAEVVLGLPTTRVQWYAGILVQDETAPAMILEPGEPIPPVPTSSWAFWGPHDDGAGSSKLLARLTTADVSADTTPLFTDRHIRLRRTGNTLDFFSRANESAAWTLRSSQSLTLPSRVRVGLVSGADEVAPFTFTASFEYLRFLAGGEVRCTLLRPGIDGCEVKENLHQFNGFEEILSDRAAS